MHNLVNFLGTALWGFHLVALFHVFHHVRQRDARVGDTAEGVDLPQEDAEAPHVTLARELVLPQSLGGSPLDWKLKENN